MSKTLNFLLLVYNMKSKVKKWGVSWRFPLPGLTYVWTKGNVLPALNLFLPRSRPGACFPLASVSVPDARIYSSRYRETRTAKIYK